MEKPALTTHNLHPLIHQRWSPRSFTDQTVSKEILQRIFEAARWAPSSSNEQPWRFIVGIKGQKTWDMIWETLVDFNQKWAKLAPVLALSIGKKTSSKPGKLNSVYSYDVGQSLAYITIQAMHEGIHVHQMGGLSLSKAAEIFKVPDEYQVLTAFALGYKGEPDLLEDSFKVMEKATRQRIGISEMVFQEEFGKTSDLI